MHTQPIIGPDLRHARNDGVGEGAPGPNLRGAVAQPVRRRCRLNTDRHRDADRIGFARHHWRGDRGGVLPLANLARPVDSNHRDRQAHRDDLLHHRRIADVFANLVVFGCHQRPVVADVADRPDADNVAGLYDAADAGDEEDPGKGKLKESKKEEDVDEDIDLDEVLRAITEEEDEVEEANKAEKLQSDLDEHRNVVKYLRSKLNEVNLLNAKLLFTNKLFRSFGLTNEQKMKVVENFDRAHNLREVKLVYSTLAESFGSKPKTEIKESKGSASKPVASTKSKKQEVIAEGHEMRERFKKLAGIIS